MTSPNHSRSPVAVALGSNLGDRLSHLRFGRRRLAELLDDLECSPVYETEPRYETDQPPFLNACCVGRCRQTPRQLLSQLHDAERAAGRVRSRGDRYGPRRLDLDLLLYGDLVLDDPGCTIPHPGLTERAFVLAPLRDVAGSWTVPGADGGSTTVTELAERAGSEGVRLWSEHWEEHP